MAAVASLCLPMLDADMRPELRSVRSPKVRYPSTVTSTENRRWVYGIFALAVAYLAAFYVIPSLLASSHGEAASGQCITHRGVGLDRGHHDGRPWRIHASIEKIEKNDRCSYWFLKVEFSPQGVGPGSWIEGWGIPAGGHLPATATIDAHEEEGGGSIGGVVGSRVRSVVLTFSSGRRIVVHPNDPSKGLRKRFVWLRGLRYFLRFYPAGEHVKTAKLLDANRRLIFTAHNREGDLVGNMVY